MRTLIKVPFALLLALYVGCVALALPQEPCNFWWSDEPPPPEPAPRIQPERWLVVRKTEGASGARVFAQHLAMPGSPAPTVAVAASEGVAWESLDSKHPAAIVAAYTKVVCEQDEVRMARLTGAELLFVNGEGFVGDPEARGFQGVPIALKRGDNDLYVLGIADSFELELWKPATRTVLGTWDVAWPGENAVCDDDFGYPVFNASTVTASHLHVHYGHAYRNDPDCKPHIGDWRDTGGMLPLGVRMAQSYYSSMMGEPCDAMTDEDALVPICVYVGGDPAPDRRLLHHARDSQRSSGSTAGGRRPGARFGTPLGRLGTEAVMVYGSAESIERVRFDQQSCWYRYWFTPEVLCGDAWSVPAPADCAADRLLRQMQAPDFVVFGNADTNKAWSRFVPPDYGIQVKPGVLTVKGVEYRGDDIVGWFQVKAKFAKRVIVIADTGTRGERLGYFLQPLFSPCGELDFSFHRANGMESGTPPLVAEGELDG